MGWYRWFGSPPRKHASCYDKPAEWTEKKEQTMEEKYPNTFAAGWKICRFAEYMLRVKENNLPKSFASLQKTGDMFWFVYKGVAIEAQVIQWEAVVNVGELVSIHATRYVGGYRSLFIQPTQCGMDVDRLEKFFAGMLTEIDTIYREAVQEENKAAIELVASLPVEEQNAAS